MWDWSCKRSREAVRGRQSEEGLVDGKGREAASRKHTFTKEKKGESPNYTQKKNKSKEKASKRRLSMLSKKYVVCPVVHCA